MALVLYIYKLMIKYNVFRE